MIEDYSKMPLGMRIGLLVFALALPEFIKTRTMYLHGQILDHAGYATTGILLPLDIAILAVVILCILTRARWGWHFSLAALFFSIIQGIVDGFRPIPTHYSSMSSMIGISYIASILLAVVMFTYIFKDKAYFSGKESLHIPSLHKS